MKFILFGTGDYYQRYKKWFAGEHVLALLDNSVGKQHTWINGVEVVAPEDGVKLSFDVVVILSFYVKAMREQLLMLGVPAHKIFHFYDLHRFFEKKISNSICCYGGADYILQDQKEERNSILLLSQDLTLGGPAIALFHAAEVLKRHGYPVVYASMIDGPLRQKLLAEKVPVIVDENLQIAVMKELVWVQKFSVIICNTINFHIFLSNRNDKIPIVWWLHDAPFFYDGIRQENLNKISKKNLYVYSVGPVPQKAIQRFMPELKIKNLLYGVSDQAELKDRTTRKETFCFVLIGFWENIKGQDVLLEALQLLTNQVRKTIEVLFVGHDKTLFAESLKKKYKLLTEVRITGSVDRKKIHEILDYSDCLICPSRQDSMPTVAAEAMMHGVPCIVSDEVGTSAFIRTGENGLVFPSGDAKQLADLILWCVQHQEEVGMMGRHARRLYEDVFSMEHFEEKMLKIMRDIM